eukprot:4755055-Prymnesium_polylepis.1
MGWTWAGRAMRDAALVRASMRWCIVVGDVQAGPSGTATPACGARGGRPTFAPFARLCAPREKRNATLVLARGTGKSEASGRTYKLASPSAN